MKRFFFLFFFLLFFSISPHAHAETAWEVTSFTAAITVQQTGVMHIKEVIAVDFKENVKHGIYREIPTIYHNGNTTSYLNISLDAVTRDHMPTHYTVSQQGDSLQIKIGDANKTLSGTQRYEIEYDVIGALKSFSDHDELYWNVTGNNWETTIKKATAVVTIMGSTLTQATCFEGDRGSNEACLHTQTSTGEQTFATKKELTSGEGLTVVSGWKKGIIPILTATKPQTFADKLLSVESLLIFVLTFLFSTGSIFWLWWTRGRDRWIRLPLVLDSHQSGTNKPLFVKEATVVEFTPPENLRPAEIGVLIDERADTIDITGTIIDLASRGYLSITELPKKWLFGSVDYTLLKKDKELSGLLPYEKELFNRLFPGNKKSVTVSSLKQTFFDDLKKVKELLYVDMADKGLFVANPEKVRIQYLTYALFLLIFAGVLLAVSIAKEYAIVFAGAAGVLLGGLILVVTANRMPRRTEKGYDLYRRIKGYRLFIETSERYRQQFFEKKNMFNEVLPYVIIFGLTGKFATAMKKLGVKPESPTWYSGTSTFNPVLFSSQLHTFSQSFSSAIAAAPQSSGFSGGSSGGGFGGGGGGSW